MASSDVAKLRPAVLAEATGTVLEIGSGPGYNFPLYGAISKLYALEPLQELIKSSLPLTHTLSFPVEFLHSSAEAIPLPDTSIDTAVSTWTLCSVENPALVLKEIKRVLKPTGKLVFIDHGLSPIFFIKMVQKIITPLHRRFFGNCHLDRNIQVLIENAGFTIQRQSNFHYRKKWIKYDTKGIAIKSK